MKLYWSSRSPFVRKVMVVAHETGLAARIETIPVVVASTSEPNPVVMRDNPLNKIPTLLTDDGMVLFDSMVICEYLDSLHGGSRLFPFQAPLRWQALRWHALGNGMLDAQMAWRTESRRPPEQQAPVTLRAFDLKIRSALDLLEREADALGAAPLGIGQVGVGCALAYLDFRFAGLDWRAARPRIAAWYEALGRRPAMQATAFVDA